MVGRWGMSADDRRARGHPADGPGRCSSPAPRRCPRRPSELVDEEVRRIVDAAHEQAVALLRGNRDKLDSLAKALLEHETLDEADAYAAAGVAGVAVPA